MTLDEASLSSQQRRVYRKATELLEHGVDAPTFSARIFGHQGELARLGSDRERRQEMLRSDFYRWLKARYSELRLRDAAQFERETRSASGRLTVIVPRSLHSALKGEAASEGVSLSELIRLKLAVPYRQMVDRLVPRPLAGPEPGSGKSSRARVRGT